MTQTAMYSEAGFVKEILGVLPKSVELLYGKRVLLDVVCRLVFVCIKFYVKDDLLTKFV